MSFDSSAHWRIKLLDDELMLNDLDTHHVNNHLWMKIIQMELTKYINLWS